MAAGASRPGVRRVPPGRSLSPILAVTSGEPAGIGPDLCLELVGRERRDARIVVLGDERCLRERAERLGRPVRLAAYRREQTAAAGALEVLHVPMAVPCRAGHLDRRNSGYVLALIDRALEGCRSGEFCALVTAPVQKSTINDAGVAFSGHTEYLSEKCAVPVVMMLTGAGLRIALATTHLALKDVPGAITAESLERTLRVLASALARDFGIARPRVLVAGLNPHAGEAGHLGREEQEVIAPVIERLKAEGFDVAGPLPADTLFTPQRLKGADCALAMYHDQGLPVLKFASFGGGINVTLGLPIIRTSVDHGTALELAGTGKADPGSLFAALATALQMAHSRQAHDAARAQALRPALSR